MPKLDLDAIEQTNRSGYPPEHAGVIQERWYRRLAPVSGITDFGASHVVLKPGAWSAHRHWHEGEDEMVVMIAGEATLLDDDGRHPMRAGDVAAFPKGEANGHVLINESGADCIYVAIGRLPTTDCHYPDVDMHFDAAKPGFTRKDGSPFTP
jgi:uncharacterized cupin superfamily protein